MKFTTIASACVRARQHGRACPHGSSRVARRDTHLWGCCAARRLASNYGNPNGNPDGPTTLSGTGDSQFAIHFLPGRVRRKTALVNRILQVAS
jgi:hypothetical protein